MVIKQVEGDKSKGLWPVRAIIVARTLIFFHFVIIFVGFFFCYNCNILEVPL